MCRNLARGSGGKGGGVFGNGIEGNGSKFELDGSGEGMIGRRGETKAMAVIIGADAESIYFPRQKCCL
jgi:hypothetical protein